MRSSAQQIVIVSGCPGSGKTTLSKALAGSASRGLHLLTDVFYGFPAAPIDPTRPESHAQNTAIVRAIARSARVFAESGYHTVVDGVLGPWFLPVVREELAGLPEVSYVVLQVAAPEARRRVRDRQGSGASAGVEKMVSEFAELGAYCDHSVATEELSPAEVLARVRSGLEQGRFRLDW